MNEDQVLIKICYSSVDGYRENSSKKPRAKPGFSSFSAVRGRGLRHRPVRRHRAARR
jgi:hypothetical protein